MIESTNGQYLLRETQARLMASSGDPTSIGPACGAITRAAQLHTEAGSLDYMVAVLSFRLSLASDFLSSLGWSDSEQWRVALGFLGGFGMPDGASVPHALADLSLVIATQIERGVEVIERDHRQMVNASIGIVDRLCWEYGELTSWGTEVDAFYSSGLFQLSSRQSS